MTAPATSFYYRNACKIGAYLDPVSVKLSPGCTNSILPGSETLCFSCRLFNDLSEPVLLTMFRVSPAAASKVNLIVRAISKQKTSPPDM